MNLEPYSKFQDAQPNYPEIKTNKLEKKDSVIEQKLQKLTEMQQTDVPKEVNKEAIKQRHTKQLQTLENERMVKIHNIKTGIFLESKKILEEVFQLVDNLEDRSLEEKASLKRSLQEKLLLEGDRFVRTRLQPRIDKLNKRNKRKNQKYLLLRGVALDRLVAMEANKSAGQEKASINASAPTEKEAIAQVAEIGNLPEFTTDMRIAENFGKRGAICVIEIEGKYLRAGSRSESGWITTHNAPAEIKGWYISNKIDYHFKR